MVKVYLKKNESTESLIKRFKKKVVKSGILSECKKRRYHISKGEKRRLDKAAAVARIKKAERKKIQLSLDTD